VPGAESSSRLAMISYGNRMGSSPPVSASSCAAARLMSTRLADLLADLFALFLGLFFGLFLALFSVTFLWCLSQTELLGILISSRLMQRTCSITGVSLSRPDSFASRILNCASGSLVPTPHLEWHPCWQTTVYDLMKLRLKIKIICI
jgi:hypothetical protein